MRYLQDYADIDEVNRLRETRNALKENLDKQKSKIRISITYADFMRTNDSQLDSARVFIKPIKMHDGSYSVVLPKEVQNVISTGLQAHQNGDSNDYMRKSKDIQRVLTLHELYHIIDRNGTEEEAFDFAWHLHKVREDRLNQTHKPS